ncbi:MAG: hypothetical protein K2L81_00980, partial [Muribaculaceae bacterium]|nr:hypothetical protein [Muribaculaceae bacterium]
MDTNFSQQLREVLDRGRREAVRHNNTVITPAHLLLALISDFGSRSFQMIEHSTTDTSAYELQQGLDQSLFESEVNEIAAVHSSDLTNRIVRLAVLEARLLKSEAVEAEHLLLAIFHNNETRNMDFMQPFI